MSAGPNPPKRRHIGRHGRSSSHKLAQAVANTRLKIDSIIARDILQTWAWGHAQATDVQRTCAAALKDFEKVLANVGASNDHIPKSIVALASLGDSGKYTGNIKRDLLQALGTPLSPPFAFQKVPVLINKGLGTDMDNVGMVDIPFQQPHVALAYWHHHNRKQFDEVLFGGPFDKAKLSGFWKEVVSRKDPNISHHPMCSRPGWFERAIPIMIHGDAVPAL